MVKVLLSFENATAFIVYSDNMNKTWHRSLSLDLLQEFKVGEKS